jgi:phosphatidylinositol-3-phosphatase
VRSRIGVAFLLAIIGLAGCGGSNSSPSPTPTPSPNPTPTPPGSTTVDHVFVVVLENHSFSQVIGNPVMPYFNSLASQHALAANYFANTHPSIGNYFMLTTGKIVTNDNLFAGTVSDDNIVRALTGAGKTWKGYFESLPSPGFIDQDAFPYDRKHNPFSFLSDVRDSSAQAANVVPLTQLASDLSSTSLPNYAFVVPNELHNAHDCPDGGTSCSESDKLAAADNWMKANLDPLIHSSAFANGVLIITWDESDLTDMANGGGQVATVLAGANVKTGFRSTTFYQHESVLRLALDLLRVGDHPGASSGAPPMTEFFQ